MAGHCKPSILHRTPTTTKQTSCTTNAVPVPVQTCVLHAMIEAPTQSLPPFAGAGLLHVLVCVPPLQALEHALRVDHPPCTVLSPVTPSTTWQTHSYQRKVTTKSLKHRILKASENKNITAHQRYGAMPGQLWVLHVLAESPTQLLPANLGAGLLQVLL